ncbi:MAG: Chaperone protein DnaJ [Firmicutes bacterium]|nr:Chaperone protein DnaJ [Bacillota bacterium]
MWDDPRRVLGMGPAAPPSEVRRAYKRLVMQHHPDAGGNAEHFKQIHSAYIRLISAADSPPLTDEDGARLRVVYGTRSYAPGYLVWRKLLRPRIVWTRGRVRLAIPWVVAVVLPAVGWSISPTATVLCGAGFVVSGQIRLSGF